MLYYGTLSVFNVLYVFYVLANALRDIATFLVRFRM